MSQRPKLRAARGTAADQEMRNQEVLRANRDLAAYFKGRRTEREARAALKIIKAFVRDRERRDAGSRPLLPRAGVAHTGDTITKRMAARDRRERKPVRKPQRKSSKPASIEPRMNPEPAPLPESDEPSRE